MKGIYNQQWQGPTTDFVVRLEKTNLEGSIPSFLGLLIQKLEGWIFKKIIRWFHV